MSKIDQALNSIKEVSKLDQVFYTIRLDTLQIEEHTYGSLQKELAKGCMAYTSREHAENDLAIFSRSKEATYWNNSGKYQDLANRLMLVTSVEGPGSKLKLFKEAGNVYYDLYNNGLINYRKEFTKIFTGLSKSNLKCIEERMDQIIKDAYEEVFGS